MFQLVHCVDKKYLYSAGGIERILVTHLRGVDPVSTHELSMYTLTFLSTSL